MCNPVKFPVSIQPQCRNSLQNKIICLTCELLDLPAIHINCNHQGRKYIRMCLANSLQGQSQGGSSFTHSFCKVVLKHSGAWMRQRAQGVLRDLLKEMNTWPQNKQIWTNQPIKPAPTHTQRKMVQHKRILFSTATWRQALYIVSTSCSLAFKLFLGLVRELMHL